MDALLPALLAAFLAEFGDKTQWLVLLLAARYGRGGAVLGGVAVAAIANALLAAFAGHLIGQMVNFRALTLLLGFALLFAGAGALLPQKRPGFDVPRWMGPFVASAFSFFVLEFGDKTQFLTTALAARAHLWPLTAAGAAVGVIAAAAVAAMGGERIAASPGIRRGVGALFLLLAMIAGLWALRLI